MNFILCSKLSSCFVSTNNFYIYIYGIAKNVYNICVIIPKITPITHFSLYPANLHRLYLILMDYCDFTLLCNKTFTKCFIRVQKNTYEQISKYFSGILFHPTKMSGTHITWILNMSVRVSLRDM